MWKSKLAVAALILGTSSAAFSRPYVVASPAPQHFVVKPPVNESVPVTPPIPFIDGRIDLGFGELIARGLQLAISCGPAFVQQIEIRYADGRSQTVRVNQQLAAWKRSIAVQVSPRAISSITIVGRGAELSTSMF